MVDLTSYVTPPQIELFGITEQLPQGLSVKVSAMRKSMVMITV